MEASMRIYDLIKGEGIELDPPGLSTHFNRGDTFLPVDGVHKKCGRTEVIGVGVKISYTESGEGEYTSRAALLMRCTGCHSSYTL